MRFSFFITFAVFLSGMSALAAPTKYKADLRHVTVFLNGAELTSTSKVNLSAGENEVLFTNIAGNINLQSLSVGINNGVLVQSVVFRNDYLAEEVLSPQANILKDSIENITINRGRINNRLSVVNEQIAILSRNQQVSGANTGLSVAELQKMLDLVKARMGDLLDDKDKLAADLTKTDERLNLLRRQLEEEKRKYYQPGGQLLVTFYAPKPANASVNITYVTPNAGWTPSYDIRADKVNTPVNLLYKAEVYQNSGISWDKVNLSLSTGNPGEGAQLPVLSPWRLAFYEPYAIAEVTQRVRKNIAYEMNAKVPAVEDAAPQASLGNHVRVDNSGINTVFDIDIPYTIPADGKQHHVAIKEHRLPATFAYTAIPKLDRDAFLQGKITDWAGLDLLPGATNIFYEGTYVGQGYIDMRGIDDTMKISLGRDKKIIVKREEDKRMKSAKTIGSNVRESFAYTIGLRNTRSEAITIDVYDQLPLSTDKDLVIEDVELNNGMRNEVTGEVKWQVTLKPGETREIKFGYTVKYPKGKRINI